MPRADQGTFSLSGPAASQANPEAVARRAYELYQQRGGEPGHEIEDWLRAEAELAARADGEPATDIGTRLDGPTAPAPTPPSLGSSGAPARKGNGSRRPQRQSPSH